MRWAANGGAAQGLSLAFKQRRTLNTDLDRLLGRTIVSIGPRLGLT